MREKLIELLDTEVECNKDGHGDCSLCPHSYSDKECIHHISEITADLLISKGVVILPVKPRDTVYTISRGKIKEWEVYYITLNLANEFTIYITDADRLNSREIMDRWIGDLVFLTEEDAINALKERKSNDHN